jgi:hypothetical protein
MYPWSIDARFSNRSIALREFALGLRYGNSSGTRSTLILNAWHLEQEGSNDTLPLPTWLSQVHKTQSGTGLLGVSMAGKRRNWEERAWTAVIGNVEMYPTRDLAEAAVMGLRMQNK